MPTQSPNEDEDPSDDDGNTNPNSPDEEAQGNQADEDDPAPSLFGELGSILNEIFSPAPDQLLAPGDRVGDFRIVEQISKSTCFVYKAVTIPGGQEVALKVLPPSIALRESSYCKRFQLEASLASFLSHPNILKGSGLNKDGDFWHFAMPLAEKSLKQWIREQDTKPDIGFPFTSIRAAHAVAEALTEAHRVGIVHRDIKPANILLSRDGKILLADFSAARFPIAGQTVDGLGTYRYMSPEQIRGNVLDRRSDIFSLAVTLYEMLTLRPLFITDNEASVALENDSYMPPRIPNVSKSINKVLNKALAIRPEDRYQSAKAFANDLSRILKKRPVRARAPSARDRLLRFTRRHFPIFSSMSITIIVAVLIGWVALWNERSNALIDRDNAKTSEAKALSISASLAYDRGQRLCEEDDIAVGLLWASRALELCPTGADLELTIRRSVALWMSKLNQLDKSIPMTSGIDCMAWHSHSKQLIVATNNKQLMFWKLKDANEIPEVIQLPRRVKSLVMFPDRNDIALVEEIEVSQAPAGNLRVVSLNAQGKWNHGSVVSSIGAVARAVGGADGRILVQQQEVGFVLWDLPSQRRIGESVSATHGGYSIAVSSNGKEFAIGNVIGEIWTIRASDAKSTLIRPRNRHAALALAYRPIVNELAVGLADFSVLLISTRDGKELSAALRHPADISALSFSEDGKTLISCCTDSRTRVWSVKDGKLLGQPMSHKESIVYTAFLSQDTWASAGRGGKKISIWRGEKTETQSLEYADQPTGQVFDWSVDRARVIVADSQKVSIRDTTSGREIASAPAVGVPLAGAFRPNKEGYLCIIAGGEGIQVISEKGRVGAPVPCQPCMVGATSSGANIWAVLKDGELRPLAVRGEAIDLGEPLFGHGKPVSTAAFCDTKSLVFIGEWDGSGTCYSLVDGTPLWRISGRGYPVSTARFSVTGDRALIADQRGLVRAIETKTGEDCEPAYDHNRGVSAVALGNDGRTIVLCRGDGSARLCDIRTGKEFGPPIVHFGPTIAIHFSSDGSQLLSTTGNAVGRVGIFEVLRPYPDSATDLAAYLKRSTMMTLGPQFVEPAEDD